MPGFFEGFAERICKEQGLIDVAPRGKATQSSLSRWSREDDAQRAVSPLGREDFAFHTDKTSSAWWQLDFEAVHFPELICIENRRRSQFWSAVSEIRVKVSTDGEIWTTLHEGKLFFGTYEKGQPLILPLDGRQAVRHIRIENPNEDYLHLRSVKVLARGIFAPKAEGLTFIANRTDGLGERLKAIVNTIVLSEHFEGDFAFSWPEISRSMSGKHAIGEVGDIFSPEFIERHLTRAIPEVELKTFLTKLCREPDAAARFEGPGLTVNVPQNSIHSIEPELTSMIPPEALSRAFWRIGFSDRMQEAVERAQEVSLTEAATGLHLRAGDIIFGRYRYNSRYLNKVVPYPLALDFVRAENARGRKVVLFGQDEEMCRALAQTHDAVFAGDYHVTFGFDIYQAALFDIVLMSRCSTVVAGNSGFSQIAHIIGRFEMVDPRDLYRPEDALRMIMQELSSPGTTLPVHELQQAFACSYAVNMLGEQMRTDQIVSLMQLACELDADNAFHTVLLAIGLYNLGDRDKAGAVLEASIAADAQRSNFGTFASLVSTRHPDGTYPLDRKVPDLLKMSEDGVEVASGLLALIFREKGNIPAAKEQRARFLTLPAVRDTALRRTIEDMTFD